MVYSVITCDKIIEITKFTPTKSISTESITIKKLLYKNCSNKDYQSKNCSKIF